MSRDSLKINAAPHPYDLIKKGASFRTWLVHSTLFIGFLAVAAKGLYINTAQDDFIVSQAESRSHRVIEIPAPRGILYDRNGKTLAANRLTYDLWVDSKVFLESKKDASKKSLYTLIGIKESTVLDKAANKKYWPMARKVEVATYEKIKAMKIPGLRFEESFKRVYPHNNLFGQTLGFLNSAGNGAEGFERLYDQRLKGDSGRRTLIKDGKGDFVSIQGREVPSTPGEDIRLTFDEFLQNLTHAELAKSVERHKAKAGAAVILDVHSGEVLAVSSLPDFDPNLSVQSLEAVKNIATSDTFEPGSTVKPFIAGWALQKRLIDKSFTINSDEAIRFGRYTLDDSHKNGLLDLTGILQKSSNVGSIRIAQILGPKEVHNIYTLLGVGKKPKSGLYNESVYPMSNPDSWKEVELATRAYGHGISMSLLQLAKAYLPIAREDGKMIEISTVINRKRTQSYDVFKPHIAKELRTMLKTVTEKGGTATQAHPSYYTAAGKTGTSRKIVNGVYVSDYVGYFVGFAPAHNPRLIMAIMVDEPKTGGYYGGIVAAPVFKSVMDRALPYLGVEPDSFEKELEIYAKQK